MEYRALNLSTRHWLSFLAVVGFSLTLVAGGSATLNLEDLDVDGFTSIEFGGGDCVDSLQSAYRSNATSCNPSAQPVFLESKTDPDTDDDIADHAWVRDDAGVYHLYFQTEDQGAGDVIEHYTSADLKNLTYVGTALTQTTDGWDRYGLWAPHVIRSGGLYYMFYTGTTGPGGQAYAKQRIGVATSTDLTNWTKLPVNNCSGTTGDGCIYECNEAWTSWDNGGMFDAQCRDPFVIRDEPNSRWLLFTTVQIDNAAIGGQWGQGTSVAQSTDLTSWTGAGYINATRRRTTQEGGTGAQLTGGVAENPFVTEYREGFHLFFTDYNDVEDYWTTPNARSWTQYVSAPTLDVDASGSPNWIYRGYTHEPGINAIEIPVVNDDTWIMSQSIGGSVNSGDNPVHYRDLRLKRMIWNDDGTFTTAKLTDLVCRVPSAEINPSMPEQCNDGLDNNCADGPDDPLTCGICVDTDSDGYGTEGVLACTYQEVDCDDTRSAVHPGAVEICADALDNNCNGETDEAGCTVVCVDEDGDGYGVSGFSACNETWQDCNDQDEFVNPGMTEVCADLLDNNCSGTADEPMCVGICVDADADGFGSSGLLSCASQQLDCNDARANVYPGAVERCDRLDNNCNQQIDENNVCRKPKPHLSLCEDGSGDPFSPPVCYTY